MTTPEVDPKVLADAQKLMARSQPDSTQRLLEDLRKIVRFVEGRPVHDA